MEGGSRFSEQNLNPDVLKEEEQIWALSIERTKEAIERNVDFNLISSIFGEIYQKCFPGISKEELSKKLESVTHPTYEVLYSLFEVDDVLERKDISESEDSAYTDGKIIRYASSVYCTSNGEVDVPYLIKTSIHELLHVFAGSFSNPGTGEIFSTGVSHQKQVYGGNHASFFEKVNEGLTELISDAVFAEYLARKGEMVSLGNQKDVHLSDGDFDMPERHMTYGEERVDLYKLIHEIGEASSFSIESIFQALVKEYFTRGYLLREEIVEAFKDFPQIQEALEKMKRNLSEGNTEDDQGHLYELAHRSELVLIKALFGRDVIGQYNKKIVDSL